MWKLVQFLELAMWLGFIAVMLVIGFYFMLDVLLKKPTVFQEILALGSEIKANNNKIHV